jgi:hypothetical protein
MLIDSGFNTNDIIAIRIQGGDEVIAKFISQDDKTIKVSKPLALTMTQQGIGMTQYLMMADMTKDFVFYKSAVVTMQKANKAAADNYIQGTTGIQPASSVPPLQTK